MQSKLSSFFQPLKQIPPHKEDLRADEKKNGVQNSRPFFPTSPGNRLGLSDSSPLDHPSDQPSLIASPEASSQSQHRRVKSYSRRNIAPTATTGEVSLQQDSLSGVLRRKRFRPAHSCRSARGPTIFLISILFLTDVGIFEVMKSKRINGDGFPDHLDDERPSKFPRSTSAGSISSAKKQATQSALDLGQRTWQKTCSECGMLYRSNFLFRCIPSHVSPGQDEDEALHKKFHKKMLAPPQFTVP